MTITCEDWIDAGINSNANLEYNFIYDDLLFLKNSYDYNPTFDTILGAGNHTITAVILDEFSLPSCVDIDIIVNNDNYGNNDHSTSNFTDWVDDIFK